MRTNMLFDDGAGPAAKDPDTDSPGDDRERLPERAPPPVLTGAVQAAPASLNVAPLKGSSLLSRLGRVSSAVGRPSALLDARIF